MPQLKIVCLAHPAVWSEVTKNLELSTESVISLPKKSRDARSWLSIGDKPGTRRGFYHIEVLDGSIILAKTVYEREVKADYRSLEEILNDEGVLPRNIQIPTPVPTASKASMFFDLREGICYVYTDTISTPLETIMELLVSLGSDCNLPCKAPRVFEWQEELVTTITDVAFGEGYQPYRVRADLETVKVTAEGDLASNQDWEKVKNSLDLGKWKTVAFLKSRKTGPFVFGMTRRRKKLITLPDLSHLDHNELFTEILNMRHLIERALGCDIRQYCFPENIKPLSQFFK